VAPSFDRSGKFIVNNLAISSDAFYTSGQVLTDGGLDATGSIRRTPRPSHRRGDGSTSNRLR
jgi:hypothetical protein